MTSANKEVHAKNAADRVESVNQLFRKPIIPCPAILALKNRAVVL